MNSDTDKYISLPEEIDYRVSDFYDMDEDLRNEEASRLYKEFSNTKKRYTEISEIASGGMKRIFRAFDQKTARYVAMAVLKEDMGEDAHTPFLAEARLNAALHHPNIIKIHDIDFNDEGKPYFTMDLKLGDSLADIIRKLKEDFRDYRFNYSLEKLLDIFIKICDAVSYSHSQGILHLDIKPENVQVGEFGEVLLCDWGLARFKEDISKKETELLDNEFLNGQTIMGKVRGTPGFMAPEVIYNKKKRSEKSDIYSLGALLYSLLTRLSPIEGNTETILKQTIKGNVTPPIERSPELSIPNSLNAVVLKAMSLDKSERYTSVSEMAEDVKKFLYGYSTSAENAGLIKEISLFYKRNKLVSIISCLSVFMLIAFIVLLENSRQNEKSLRITAEKEKLKAQENFQKYKAEKEIADSVYKGLNTFDGLKDKFHKNFLTDPKSALADALKALERIKVSNKDATLLYEFKGDLHFVRQEFDLALLELKKGRGEFENRALFKALNSIKDYKSDGKPAPVTVIQKLIKNLEGQYQQQLLRLLIYDNEVRIDRNEHTELVKTVFKVANKISELEEFKYDANTKSLTISGDCSTFSFNYPVYNSPVSLLTTLDLKHLKLQNNNIFHAKNFLGLRLETLDLQGIRLDMKRQIVEKGIANKILVSKALIKANILESLKRNSEVILEP